VGKGDFDPPNITALAARIAMRFYALLVMRAGCKEMGCVSTFMAILDDTTKLQREHGRHLSRIKCSHTVVTLLLHSCYTFVTL
jgi:hypothetical protein